MIDKTFRNINRLVVLSFKSSNNDPNRSCFFKNYMALDGIKDFNALIDKKIFFNEPIKSKKKKKKNIYGKLVKVSRNNNYKTRNLLWKQANTSIP